MQVGRCVTSRIPRPMAYRPIGRDLAASRRAARCHGPRYGNRDGCAAFPLAKTCAHRAYPGLLRGHESLFTASELIAWANTHASRARTSEDALRRSRRPSRRPLSARTCPQGLSIDLEPPGPLSGGPVRLPGPGRSPVADVAATPRPRGQGALVGHFWQLHKNGPTNAGLALSTT